MEFFSQFFPARLDHYRAVRKDNGWDAVKTVINPCYEFPRQFIGFDPYLEKSYVVVIKKCLDAQAITALLRCIHDDL